MKKQIVTMLLTCSVITGMASSTVSASAPEHQAIQSISRPSIANPMTIQSPTYSVLRWSITESIVMSLSHSGGNVKASTNIKGNSSVTNISATFTLKVKESNGTYSVVKDWSNVTSNSKTLAFSESTSASSGKTYRIYVTATLTSSDGTTETVEDYFEKAL